MPTIPPALLRQLYQRGSLRNMPSGWQLAMRNHLAPATLVGLDLVVDDGVIDPAALSVARVGEVAFPVSVLSAEAPFRFAAGVETIVRVAGAHLPAGPHTLALRAHTQEIGLVTITVQDTVAG